jgi:pimeloyl-ACP methyl ester carboxylesterase
VLPKLEADHRVIAIDLLGHGGSEKPASGYTPPNQAKLVVEALRRLGVSGARGRRPLPGRRRRGRPRPAEPASGRPRSDHRHAPDNSYGGLGFIANIAFQPVLGEALWTIKPDFSVRDGLKVAFGPGFDVPDAFADDVNRLTYAAYDESPSGVDDYLGEESLDKRMRQTGLPLMVLMGAEEQVVNDPERALDQYATVPGAETHLVEGAGHSPNVEKPAETAALLLKTSTKLRNARRGPRIDATRRLGRGSRPRHISSEIPASQRASGVRSATGDQ